MQLQINSTSLSVTPQFNEASCNDFSHTKSLLLDPFTYSEQHVALGQMGAWKKDCREKNN